MCIYISVFSLEDSVRTLELFIYEGPKLLLRIGLAIFRLMEKNILQINDFSDLLLFLQTMTTGIDFNEVIKVMESFFKNLSLIDEN